MSQDDLCTLDCPKGPETIQIVKNRISINLQVATDECKVGESGHSLELWMLRYTQAGHAPE